MCKSVLNQPIFFLLKALWMCKETDDEKGRGSKMTTEEWICVLACKNSCWFCFEDQHRHHTHQHSILTETSNWKEVGVWKKNTLVTHLPHPLLRKTKAANYGLRIHPELRTQNARGPLVCPLKHEDIFFVLDTNAHSHTQTQAPPYH